MSCLDYVPVALTASPPAPPPVQAIDQSTVGKLATPLLCIQPLDVELDLTFTIKDTNGTPQQGVTMTIGSQTGTTDANGSVGPFKVETDGAPVQLTLKVTQGGSALSGRSITLGGVAKSTDAQGQVVFNIGGNGSVS